MLDNITATFSKFVWRYLYPKNLITGIAQSILLSCRSFSNAKELLNSDYNPTGVGDILCVSIPTENIRSRCLISGVDSVSTGTKSGTKKDSVFTYIVSGLPDDLVAIGKAPDSDMALLYVDFCKVGLSYVFKENPAKLGTINTSEEQPKISFYCLLANSKHKHKSPITAQYKEEGKKEIVEVSDFVKVDGAVTNGISGAGINTVAGNKPATKYGEIKNTWSENGKYFCATDSEILTIAGSNFSKQVGESIKPGQIAGKYNSAACVFSVNGKNYWTDQENVLVSLYPGLSTEYPLIPVSSGVAKLDELIGTLHSIYGKDTVVVDTSAVKGSEKILESLITATGSIHISDIISETLKSIHDVSSSEDYDTIYIFYGSGDSDAIAKTADAIVSKNGGGAVRITNCIKGTDGYIYGSSVGCEYIGNRPSLCDKIYAVGVGPSSSDINIITKLKYIEKRNLVPTKEIAIKLYIDSGSSSSSYFDPGAVVISSGTTAISSGNPINNYTVANGYRVNVSNTGIANAATVNSGGYLTIFSGGHADDTTVNSYGHLFVSSGGTATNFNVSTYGRCRFAVAPNTYIDGYVSGSSVHIASTAGDIVVNAGCHLYVSSGGVLDGVTLNKDGYLIVSSGGKAINVCKKDGAVVSSAAGAVVEYCPCE